MTRLPKIVEVQPLPGHLLKLKFEEGEVRIFDMSPYIRPDTVFAPLQNDEVFSSVKIGLGTVTWPNGADFAPESLFRNSTPLTLDSQGS